MSEQLPEMIPVVSSNLKAVGYRPDSRTDGEIAADMASPEELFIDFGGEFVFGYRGPDLQTIFTDLMAAESKGGYFAMMLKNSARHRVRKIPRERKDDESHT